MKIFTPVLLAFPVLASAAPLRIAFPGAGADGLMPPWRAFNVKEPTVLAITME